MADKPFLYLFVRTEDGIRSRRLRDYPWHDRIGWMIILAVLVVLLVLRSA